MAKKKVGITIDEKLHASVKAHAATLGTTVEQAYEAALRNYLNLEKTDGLLENLPRSDRLLIEKLIRILRSGNADAIKAVTSNIKVFDHYIDLNL